MLHELCNIIPSVQITASGNITNETYNTDINECEQEPYPCDESAICYNTDGSFYCKCQEGFSGDGFECTGNAKVFLALYVEWCYLELHTISNIRKVISNFLCTSFIYANYARKALVT